MNIKHIVLIIACTTASPNNAWTVSSYLTKNTHTVAIIAQFLLFSFAVTELVYNPCPEEVRHLKTYGQEPQPLHKVLMRIHERKKWLLFALANLVITKHLCDHAIYHQDVAAFWKKLYQTERDLSPYS